MLVNAEVGRIGRVLDDLLQIAEVSEVYTVAGPYDIVAKVEADRFEKLTEIIPKFHEVQGVTKTLTLLAFGISRQLRTEACEQAAELAEQEKLSELYELCRGCKQLKFCGYGARVITYGF